MDVLLTQGPPDRRLAPGPLGGREVRPCRKHEGGEAGDLEKSPASTRRGDSRCNG